MGLPMRPPIITYTILQPDVVAMTIFHGVYRGVYPSMENSMRHPSVYTMVLPTDG